MACPCYSRSARVSGDDLGESAAVNGEQCVRDCMCAQFAQAEHGGQDPVGVGEVAARARAGGAAAIGAAPLVPDLLAPAGLSGVSPLCAVFTWATYCLYLIYLGKVLPLPRRVHEPIEGGPRALEDSREPARPVAAAGPLRPSARLSALPGIPDYLGMSGHRSREPTGEAWLNTAAR